MIDPTEFIVPFEVTEPTGIDYPEWWIRLPVVEKQVRLRAQKITSIGRNDKCPCGSELKFKKCCMR